MSRKRFAIGTTNLAGGYYSQARNRKPAELAPPSQNVRLTLVGEAYSRPGFNDTGWTIGTTAAGMTAFRMTRYNLTFFAIPGVGVYYRQDSDGIVYSLGVTPTAATSTTFAEYQGDVWMTNSTDGITIFHISTVKTAVTAGNSTINAELGTAFRVPTSGNLRIKGTNEAYSSVDTATDIYTLTGTASQNYAVGDTIVVVEGLSSLPKGSKLAFFFERAHVIGVTSNSASQVSRWTVFCSAFSIATAWSNIKTFDWSTAGSTRTTIGSAGVLQNLIPTQTYLYFFKDNETYYLSYADISTTTGANNIKLLSNQFGTPNQFCAADMNGFAVWLTKNKRIIRSQSQITVGGSLLYPDEEFDQAIRDDLNTLDDDQSAARVHYWKKGKLLFVQCSVQGSVKTFVYDNNLQVWLPPDTNKYFYSFFEINGTLYATDALTNTVFQLETTSSDNGAYIFTTIAGGIMTPTEGVSTSDWKDILVRGRISNATTVTYTPTLDAIDQNAKKITIADAKVTSSTQEVGSVGVGSGAVGSDSAFMATSPYYKRMLIYKSKGQEYQHRFSAAGDGQLFSVSAWTLTGSEYSDPFFTSH